MVTLPDERGLSYWQAIRRGPAYHWVVPILVIVVPGVFWFVSKDVYWFLEKEDRVVEWSTFAGYALGMVFAAACSVLLWKRSRRLESVMWAGATVLLFAFAGEEISWGQRIFGFAGPTVLTDANQQHEDNLHNLLGSHVLHGGYIAMGLFFAFGLRLIVPRISPLARRAWLYVPPKVLTPWFLASSVFYFAYDYLDEAWHAAYGTHPLQDILKLEESCELAFAIGLMLFAFWVLGSIRAGWIEQGDPYVAVRAADPAEGPVA